LVLYLAFNFGHLSDAPALSTDQDPFSIVSSSGLASESKDRLDQINKDRDGSEQWDDEAMAANTFKKNAVVASSTSASSAGVLDMKSFDSKRTDPDNIAEKLRVEETKAQLAAAREGMEREAAKLKEERDKKEQAKLEAEKSRNSSSVGGTSGIWVAPHLRASTNTASLRTRMGGTTSQKLDVQDEELFPDLAAAEKILEKKEKDQAPVFKVNKKTPVGGGASWASKTTITSPPANASKPTEDEVVAEVSKSEPVSAPELVPEAQETSSSNPPNTQPVDTTASQQTVRKTVTKKKKKDLSTFKPGS
jgi:hypothetical protein